MNKASISQGTGYVHGSANSWSFDSTVGDDPQLIIGAGEGHGVAWGKGRLSTVKGRE